MTASATEERDVVARLGQALRAHRPAGDHVRVPESTVKDAADEITRLRSQAAAPLRPMREAKKDGTPVLGLLRSDLVTIRPDLDRLHGLWVVVRNRGGLEEWGLAGPFGYGGLPDEWFVGFKEHALSAAPLPAVAVELCEHGNCVLNGPGVEGGDCVCDGKPLSAAPLPPAVGARQQGNSRLVYDKEQRTIINESTGVPFVPPPAVGAETDAEIDDLEQGELRPCPFCGSPAEAYHFEAPECPEDDENIGGSCIQCTRCQASSAVVFGYKETLYSSWNERSGKVRSSAVEAARKDERELCARWHDAEAARYADRAKSASEIGDHDLNGRMADIAQNHMLSAAAIRSGTGGRDAG